MSRNNPTSKIQVQKNRPTSFGSKTFLIKQIRSEKVMIKKNLSKILRLKKNLGPKNLGSKKIWVPKNVGSMIKIIFGSKETLIILFVYGILIYKVVGKSYCLLKLFRVESGRVGSGRLGCCR